jgi:hypothetical protein
MRSPAAAIAWQIVRPHRAPLAACALVWLVLVVLTRLLPLHGGEAPVEVFVLILPSSFVLVSLLYCFSFATVTSIGTREGAFPRRLFTLPLSTRTLVAWPMFVGSLALAAAWPVWAIGVLWPCGAAVPLVWPAVFLAAFLAWLQALSWLPFPSTTLRAPAAGLLLGGLTMLAIFGAAVGVPEWILALFGILLLAAGYGAALGAVRLSRRGDAPEWPWFDRLVRQLRRLRLYLRRRHPFASPLAAQAWLDWRRSGHVVPVLVGVVVFLLVLGGSSIEQFLGERTSPETPPALADLIRLVSPASLVLGLFLCAPLALAAVLGYDQGIMRTAPQANAYAMSTFLALRPLSCAELIAAKLRMAVRATFWSWALALAGASCWLLGSGSWRSVLDAPFLQPYPTWKIAIATVLLVALLMAVTWENLVAAMWAGLTGRLWVNLTLSLLIGIVWIPVGLAGYGLWVYPEYLPLLWRLLPWLAAGLVLLKLALAAWLAREVHRRRLLAPRTLFAWAAGWVVAVGSLFLLLECFLPEGLLPRWAKPLAAVLVVPLARFAVMPLALHWNRHR